MRLTQITPFVPCTSLDRQIGFYRDRLGFTLGYRAENYAFLHRDDVALRLIEVDPQVDLSAPEREQMIYIDVDDVDAVWTDMAPRLSPLPPERYRAPFDQEYGQREFHVADEDCTLILFGAQIRQADP